jgi:Mn2+/Fe2+ NRAMP family transporter
MAETAEARIIRKKTHAPPQGKKRVKMLGPGLIWMVSSIGSGTILFTPRIGAQYEYSLLWMALAVSVLIYFMIREVARFTIVTGRTITNGFQDIPGPRNWAIWFITLPQLAVVVMVVSGVAALAGSAIMIAFETNLILYAVILITLCALLVVSGKYSGVEKATTVMAGVLVLVTIITAVRVLSSPQAMGAGLVPTLPDDFDIYFVLPWVGFFLAGASGVLWFSYWVGAREFGGPTTGKDGTRQTDPDAGSEKAQVNKLNQWIKVLNLTTLTGIILGTLINVAFLILGAELLAPEGIVPEGVAVAEDLTRLLSEVWGQLGYWFLLISIVIALGGTILANQDGGGRMFSDATIILLPSEQDKKSNGRPGKGKLARKFTEKSFLSKFYSIGFGAVLPALIYIVEQDPVRILSLAGIISAIQIPFIIFMTLYLNKKRLPKPCQPNAVSLAFIILAGAAYGILAVIQLLSAFEGNGG